MVSVTGGNGFNEPLRGYVDWIEAAMPVIAIFGISYVQRMGGHIRMDIVVGALGGRMLWLVEFITTLLVLVLLVLLVWGTWAHFDRSFDMTKPNWSRDSSIDIGLPIWPAKLVVPVAFAVVSARLLLQLWGYGRAFLLGLERPVAVPLVQSAAEQAAEEALHMQGMTNDVHRDRLWVTGGMLVLVVLGMRVAFAAAMAGLAGWSGSSGPRRATIPGNSAGR